MVIVFGDWRLSPCGGTNWELQHRTKGEDGAARWRKLGRFYQRGTLHLALEHAADWEQRNGQPDRALDFMSAATEYMSLLCEFRADIQAALERAAQAQEQKEQSKERN